MLKACCFALLVLASSVSWVAAQEPAPVQPGEKPAAGKPAPRDRAPVQDPEVDAWVKLLIERMTHPNETIRGSAQDALVRVGRPAIGPLKELAAGDDARGKAAREVLARAERRGGKPDQAGDGRRGMAPENMFADAAKAAKLTADQESKVKAMFEEARVKMQELYAQARDGVLTREEVKAALQGMEKERREALKTVLNEAQVEAFMEAMQRARPNPPRRREDGER